MAYGRAGTKTSNIAVLLTASHIYGMTESQAREIVDQVIAAIRDG
ncbi:hypothetical protein [Salinibacterium sp.]|nr:hypothetical protein [Salinibacterium sp.]